jgi:hypothetical protein
MRRFAVVCPAAVLLLGDLVSLSCVTPQHIRVVSSSCGFLQRHHRRDDGNTTRHSPPTRGAAQSSPSDSPRRLSHLSLRQIQIELFRFGRRRVYEHQLLAPMLEELINRPPESSERSKFVRVVVVRDALYLAHAAGLHSHCCELFLTTTRQAPGSLPLSEAVVDSAYTDGSAAVLGAIVDAAESRLKTSPTDIATEVSLFRIVWLCALKCVELKEEEHVISVSRSQQQLPRRSAASASSSSDTSVAVSRGDGGTLQEELTETFLQYEIVARDAFEALRKRNGGTPSPKLRTSGEWIAPPIEDNNTNNRDEATTTKMDRFVAVGQSKRSSTTFDTLWTTVTRFVRYHYADDGGEAQYYKHLYDNSLLQSPHASHTVTALIRSCNKSQNTKLVKEYFTRFISHVMEHDDKETPRSEVDGEVHSDAKSSDPPCESVADGRNTEQQSSGGEGAPSASVVVASAGREDANRSQLQEVVVHTYFQTLINCRAFKDVVDSAEYLFSQLASYKPSSSIVAVISRAAGETRNAPLAAHCATLLFTSTALSTPQSTTTTPSGFLGHEQGIALAADVSHVGWGSDGAVVEDAKGLPSNYEVFLTLMALAKCHTSTFPLLLQKVLSVPAIAPNAEEALCLQLHYLRRSPNVLIETNKILDAIRAKPIAAVSLLSVRNMTLLLLLLQHSNHDEFLEWFRDFCKRSSERRALWVLIFFQWAETRRNQLSIADREMIIGLLRELHDEEHAMRKGNRGRSAEFRHTSSIWHTVTASINPLAGDAALQRGAASVFIADCCLKQLLTPVEAFATAHGAAAGATEASTLSSASWLPQWPGDDTALRFAQKPSQQLCAGLRAELPASSLLEGPRHESYTGGALAPADFDGEIEYKTRSIGDELMQRTMLSKLLAMT